MRPPLSWLRYILFSPHPHRLRTGWRLLGHFSALVLCINLFSLVTSLWLPSDTLTDIFSLPGQLITSAAITLAVYGSRCWLDRRSFTSLGLGWDFHALRDLIFGIGLSGLLIGLIYLAEWAPGWLDVKGFAWQSQSSWQVWREMLVIFAIFVLVGWQEELLARGYWLQNLADGTNLFWGMIISSGLFALAHLGNLNVSPMAMLGLFAAGLFMAYGYLRTQQLWLPIGLHIGWNFFEGAVFGFRVSGLDTFRLIQQSVHGPELLTGGRFGPEAGLIVLPALLLGAGLIWWYTRRLKQVVRDQVTENQPS